MHLERVLARGPSILWQHISDSPDSFALVNFDVKGTVQYGLVYDYWQYCFPIRFLRSYTNVNDALLLRGQACRERLRS